MTRKERLLKKFLNNPDGLKYKRIEKLLLKLGFERIEAKGSHRKLFHHSLDNDLIIPVHGNDCKRVYKDKIAKIIKEYFYE